MGAINKKPPHILWGGGCIYDKMSNKIFGKNLHNIWFLLLLNKSIYYGK